MYNLELSIRDWDEKYVDYSRLESFHLVHQDTNNMSNGYTWKRVISWSPIGKLEYGSTRQSAYNHMVLYFVSRTLVL